MTLFARSWLYVPAQRERMVARAATCGADAVIFDLEDAVPAAEKGAARELLVSTLAAWPNDGPQAFVRINALEGYAEAHADFDAAVRPGLAGLVVPKVEDAVTVKRLCDYLDVWEAARGLPEGSIALVPMIESPRALLLAREIALESPRVVGLAFGGEDYKQVVRAPIAEGTAPAVAYARAALVVAARAADVEAIDGVWTRIDDLDGCTREATEARALGFGGKTAIHPSHIAPIHAAFAPSEAEIAHARAVVEAAAAGEARGEGAVRVDGEMVDPPVLERARALLERAAR